MVILRDLQDVCKLLMSKINSTPSSTISDTSSVRYRRNKLLQKRPPYFCDTMMRNSTTSGSNKHKQSVKISNSTGKQEHVLKILNNDKSPIKESCFSPYTPLPAIGNHEETKRNSRPRIQRQLTYNVLEPVFVKGPIDFNSLEHKYIISHSNKKSKPSEIHKTVLNKKNILNKNIIHKQSEDYETLEDRKKRMREEFSRKIHGNRIKINKDLIEATAKLKSDGKAVDKNAFWMEF